MKLDCYGLIFFLKNTQISNLIKIYSVGAELLHAYGQTHRQIDRQTVRRDEDESRFSQFYEGAWE
jgi:hypothetical protein